MKVADIHGIQRFLKDYPGMSLAPSRGREIVLKGVFEFRVQKSSNTEIRDSYNLKISVPAIFPNEFPRVEETGRKIPRDGYHHVNLSDDTLCLGSPLRLRASIPGKPDLVKFAERCLVPFLYSISHELQGGSSFPFGELDHDNPGIIADYLDMFGLNDREQVIQTLKLLGKKRRIANRVLCPCGCGFRLGKCSFNRKLAKYRKVASRSWFRAHVADLES